MTICDVGQHVGINENEFTHTSLNVLKSLRDEVKVTFSNTIQFVNVGCYVIVLAFIKKKMLTIISC